MVTKQGIIKYLTLHSNDLGINLDIENNKIYDNKSGDLLCSIDDYIDTYKLKIGCSFKSIFYSHVFLENVLKCNKCGTVIITKEDESYDPKLRCPTCTDYKTYFKYYTKDQIENNDDIKKLIESYIDMQKFQDEARQYEEKHGHPYWEIFTKKIHTKKYMYIFELKCDDLRKSWFNGLHLIVSKYLKKEEKGCYSFKSHIIIPLSFSKIYVHWIYPHLGKCHKDFRSKWFIGKPIENKNREDE